MRDRHGSTIARELRRNRSRYHGSYRLQRAQEQANGRRSRSRRKSHFTETDDWQLITDLLRADLGPEQISGPLRAEGRLEASHETIYQYTWRDKHRGGKLYRRLRQRPKYRKRYGTREKARPAPRETPHLRASARRRAAPPARSPGNGYGRRHWHQRPHRLWSSAPPASF